MLVFPELGKGNDQSTLSTSLFERTGQCCSLCRYQVAACDHPSNLFVHCGSFEVLPFQRTSRGTGRLDTTSATQHVIWGNCVRRAWWMKGHEF